MRYGNQRKVTQPKVILLLTWMNISSGTTISVSPNSLYHMDCSILRTDYCSYSNTGCTDNNLSLSNLTFKLRWLNAVKFTAETLSFPYTLKLLKGLYFWHKATENQNYILIYIFTLNTIKQIENKTFSLLLITCQLECFTKLVLAIL